MLLFACTPPNPPERRVAAGCLVALVAVIVMAGVMAWRLLWR
jgi:hypothetical protein